MQTNLLSETVQFTTKGQVVIPAKVRRHFQIEKGSRASVVVTDEGILLKPVTRHSINRLRGILKRKPGAKPFAEVWAGHKREEKALEERRHAGGSA